MSTRMLIIVVTFTLLSGCAQTWVKVTQSETVSPASTFAASLPLGWVRFEAEEDVLLVTRDGLALQTVLLRRSDLKLAFEKIKKDAEVGMLASELAELYVAETKQSGEAENLKVKSNHPARVAGRDGFRLHLVYANAKGLRIDRVVYGFVDTKGFFTLSYTAPKRYHFERYLQNFESTVASFRQLQGNA